MLPFQVGAIDPPSRRYGAGNKSIVSKKRESVTHFHLRRFLSFWLAFVWIALAITQPALCGQPKGRKKKGGGAAATGKSQGEPSLTNIPLPIGHEAKGLVLPDFDTEGRLRGKFEAGTAHRIDLEHVGFEDLKITTYTPQSEVDLQINMHTSVLDLKTRILSSQERTTIKRSDFNIAGDSVQFDTNAKTGRLIGNVKMVITDKSHLTAKPNTSE